MKIGTNEVYCVDIAPSKKGVMKSKSITVYLPPDESVHTHVKAAYRTIRGFLEANVQHPIRIRWVVLTEDQYFDKVLKGKKR